MCILQQNLPDATRVLKAMANESRLQIMCELAHGEKCVGDLEKLIGLSQSALSQHLARLRKEQLVTTRRDAQTIYYSLLDGALSPVLIALGDCFGAISDSMKHMHEPSKNNA